MRLLTWVAWATVSPESIELASQEAAKQGALYCMNLSAPFLMQVPPFKACFVKTIPNVDFLFGNETEAATWAETEGWDTKDVAFIATRLSLIPSAKGKHRYVVITQGPTPQSWLTGGTRQNILSRTCQRKRSSTQMALETLMLVASSLALQRVWISRSATMPEPTPPW